MLRNKSKWTNWVCKQNVVIMKPFILCSASVRHQNKPLRQTALLIMGVMGLSGCATKPIAVVDTAGNPVENALVLSEEIPYIFQSWKLGIYLTDENGKAKTVGGAEVLKPGYFPTSVSESSENATMYKIEPDKNIPVKTKSYTTETPATDGKYIVPVGICPRIQVTYTPDNSRIKVASGNNDIIPSDQFYFVGASTNRAVSELERNRNIVFYCHDDQQLYKVGVKVVLRGSVREASTHKQQPRHELKILTAKVQSPDDYLQPEVECPDSSNDFPLTRNYEGKRHLYTSPGLADKLHHLDNYALCPNRNLNEAIRAILPPEKL